MYDAASRTVKLLDFGIAADTEAHSDERLTRAGHFVGTLMYVAPEALTGEMVSFQADQYSLATIAYYLLTGTLPYVARNPREMFTQLLTQPPIPISKARKDIVFSDVVERVISRALSRNPSDRFPTVSVFAQELRDVLAKIETAAVAAEPVERQSKWKSLFRFGR
jgi:serine/threonine-protein kinase